MGRSRQEENREVMVYRTRKSWGQYFLIHSEFFGKWSSSGHFERKWEVEKGKKRKQEKERKRTLKEDVEESWWKLWWDGDEEEWNVRMWRNCDARDEVVEREFTWQRSKSRKNVWEVNRETGNLTHSSLVALICSMFTKSDGILFSDTLLILFLSLYSYYSYLWRYQRISYRFHIWIDPLY